MSESRSQYIIFGKEEVPTDMAIEFLKMKYPECNYLIRESKIHGALTVSYYMGEKVFGNARFILTRNGWECEPDAEKAVQLLQIHKFYLTKEHADLYVDSLIELTEAMNIWGECSQAPKRYNPTVIQASKSPLYSGYNKPKSMLLFANNIITKDEMLSDYSKGQNKGL